MITQSTHLGMDTIITHNLFGRHTGKALQAAKKEIARLDRTLNRFVAESEISRINRSAGNRCEKVSGETVDLLAQAVQFSRCAGGYFDITIGPLVTLWRIYKDKLELPYNTEIEQALSLVNYADLVFDYRKKAVGLKQLGQSIDLGGIGKGYAADKIVDIFKHCGIASAFTNLGGNIATIGAKPDGSPWIVGIQHPRQEDKLIGVVSVINKSVVTSGDYQRYFMGNNGKRYHHILDPYTGYPVETGLISVTVISESAMTADALSTIIFTVGLENGIEILNGFPGTEAILIDENLSVYITPGLKEDFRHWDISNSIKAI